MDKIWWEKTDGARKFLAETIQILLGGRSVILCLPKNLPWRDTMHEVLRRLLREKFTGTTREVKSVDVGDNPRKYVMKNFCENKSGFRPYGDEAYAEFLAEAAGTDISLNTTCLWIQNSESETDDWFDFIEEYHKFLDDRRGGVFLLETSDNFNVRSSKGIEILSYDRKISDYDNFAFHILIASEFCRENDLTKQYLAELVTQLVGNNVELGAACVKHGNEFLKNPRKVFTEILNAENFSSTKTEEETDFAIWLTQLKLTFPLIEIFRRNLIKNYHAAISSALPCNSGYGERIEMSEQAELGTLVHLVNLKQLWFNKSDWDELTNYLSVRNRLAHLKTLPFDELQRIFDKNSSK